MVVNAWPDRTAVRRLAAGLRQSVAGTLLAAGMLLPTTGETETIGQGSINAVSFQPLPAKTTVKLRVLDNSDENLKILQQISEGLEKRGVSVTNGDAPLLLSIEAGQGGGAFQAERKAESIPTPDDRGRLYPQGRLDISRIGQYPRPETGVVTPVQYQIMLTLDDQTRGTRFWQGWASADLSLGTPPDLADAMIPSLVNAFGKTVREENFDISAP